MPSHLCLFPPISSSPPLPVSAYLYPTNSARLHLSLTGHFCSFISRHHFPFASISVYTPPSVRLHLSLPGQFCSFASVSTPPPLSVYVYLCPVNNVSMSLSANSGCWLLLLVCQQCPFTSISTPHTYTTDRLRLSLSGHFCSFASICSAKSTRLPVSATQTIPGCVYHFPVSNAYLHLSLHHPQCTFASISARQLWSFASISASTSLTVCVYLCPANYTRLHLCHFASVSALSPLSVYFYLRPANNASFRLSLTRQQCSFAPISAPPPLPLCVFHWRPPLPVRVYHYSVNNARLYLSLRHRL